MANDYVSIHQSKTITISYVQNILEFTMTEQ